MRKTMRFVLWGGEGKAGDPHGKGVGSGKKGCLKNPEKTWKKLLTNGEGSGIVSKLSETRRSCRRESKKVFNEVKKVLDKLWKLW